MIKMS